MKFSLVLATIQRVAELELFLASLAAQTYQNFELIVVDQNLDDRLLPLIESYKDHFAILHLQSEKGLSKARNVGLAHISGDVVAFPDDDCAYPPSLLEKIAGFLTDSSKWNGLIGRSTDGEGNDSSGRWDHEPGAITPINVWRRGTSFTIFLRRSTVDQVGVFDESLGVGAGTPWGSGEDVDYLLRAVPTGLYYDPQITVVHPVQVAQPSTQAQSTCSNPWNRRFFKTYAYAMGRGRVLRKHNTPLWFLLYNWGRPLVGMGLSLVRGRFDQVRSYWATFQGRVQGWMGWA